MINQEVKEYHLDTLYGIQVDGQLMDSNGNYFGVLLWDSHEMFNSISDAQKALNCLRANSIIDEEEGEIVRLDFNMSSKPI